MSIHAVILGLVIATLCASVFHLLRGGRVRHLFLYILVAWVSFFIGQLFSESISWRLLRIGSINLFPALLATLLGLILAAVFIAPETRTRRR
ncbi:MAG: hypothetical protein PVH60_07000 [Anaerolineales bacterium]|jgi:hypothetical protein